MIPPSCVEDEPELIAGTDRKRKQGSSLHSEGESSIRKDISRMHPPLAEQRWKPPAGYERNGIR
jgi:hypothetical protein